MFRHRNGVDVSMVHHSNVSTARHRDGVSVAMVNHFDVSVFGLFAIGVA